MKNKAKAGTIDAYIAGFPQNIQKLLQQVRATIKKAAPEAQETISYQMPCFVLNGNLVYFAAFKNHIGFYPTSSGIKSFQKDLAAYKGAKGSVQFPLDQPIPFDLISKITTFRVQENLQKTRAKKNQRVCSKGHKYSKSTDCPTCPICEQKRKPKDGFLSILSAPAQRALENKGIATVRQLSKYSEKQILALHGMGPNSIPKLRKALKAEGLIFKRDSR